MADDTSLNATELAAELTAAWLSNQNNRISAEEVPAFLRSMYATLTSLGSNTSAAENGGSESQNYEPAVSARKSLGSRDHIISMIDGKPYKTLRRHLSRHGLTPEQYRERYNLKPDYPMVAPGYSETRRDLAKKIGLGSKSRGTRRTETAAPPARKPRQAKPAE